MLSNLVVKNFALMERLDVDFNSGLNVLTGETGAGKSILIKALSLLQGERSSLEFIRDQAETAEVIATFSGLTKGVLKALKHLDIEVEDNQLILKRTISRKGNHKVSANGTSLTLQELKTISQELLEICGQHDNQKLTDQEYQRETIDAYGSLEDLTLKVKVKVQEITALKKEKQSLIMDPGQRLQRMDFLKFQISEIKDNWVSSEEEKSLDEKLRKALGSKDLLEACDQVEQGLFGEEYSAITSLERTRRFVSSALKHEPLFKEQEETLNSVISSLEDLGEFFNKYKKSLNADEKSINVIIEKTDQIKKLKRKYGPDLSLIKEKQDSLSTELKKLKDLEETQKKIDQKIKLLESEAMGLAQELREKRKASAQTLSKKVIDQLKDLNMNGAKFSVSFTEKELSLDGIDSIVYEIAPNKGEGLKPLGKIASGGELSRIMLAITRVITEKSDISLYVFDEVDAGIGGDTGKIVGEKMLQVSQGHQVLCITHLPQVAVYANHNFLISKKEENKRTVSEISILDKAGKIREISRMLGGGLAQKQSLENATAMVSEAEKAHKT